MWNLGMKGVLLVLVFRFLVIWLEIIFRLIFYIIIRYVEYMVCVEILGLINFCGVENFLIF